MTDADNDQSMQVILQVVEDGMVRCLGCTWGEQHACTLAIKSMNRDECLYYYDPLQHCWLPDQTGESE